MRRRLARPYAIIGCLATLADRARCDASLEADVLGVIDQTFHPTNADVWIRGASHRHTP